MTRHGQRYAFAEFILDVDERRLSRDTVVVPLPPKAFDVLLLFVRNAGQLVTKTELLDHVWRDAFVEEGVLTVYMALLRKALGDRRRPYRYIQTVARFGYRFVSPVTRLQLFIDRRAADTDNDATEYVMRGQERLLNGSCFAARDAVDAFQSAIRANESDASAHAGFAIARCAQAQNLAAHPRQAYRDARRAVLRAVALDQRHADVQVALATLLFFSEWDLIGAECAVRRALESDPRHIGASVLYGDLLDACGHIDDGLEMKTRGLQWAPNSTFVLTQIAVSFWRKRDYEQTIRWTQQALVLDPTHITARMYLAFALWKTRRYDAVTVELVKQAECCGLAREWLIRPPGESSATQETKAWPDRFTRLVMTRLPTAAGGPSAINDAVASGERRETDAAFRHLDRVIARRHPCLVHLGVDPQWDTLRVDPRFRQRLDHIGLTKYV